ncbi:rhodanese-related sulfurtransferase [Roseimicrobium gellanilyticum]|uniref:Rhodanese-related sulfurtransferase n=1 Tax=Roseimicrobium gellanilyticum TaxID=748857 RepID=A0A366H6G7_9BACT|nr:YceI family protein [Roseimicrobium gellanilyticum]RBP37710.1 rhodanese-related sulfurtransferase [Roseimicrobium gellanilyticum]
MSTTITPAVLQDLRTQHPNLLLLDVRLPEDFAEGHLPGAVNQCVYEMVFLPELEKQQLAKDRPIAVYGAAESSLESQVAAEKLERAGFTNVFDFRGGLAAWVAYGLRLENVLPPAAPPAIRNGTHALDLTESRVVWVGRNLINKHWGQVAIRSGEVVFENGSVARGEVVLDLKRITCSDLAGSDLHDVLIAHLESDDFFDVERFPEARFTIERTEVCADCPGSRNLRLHGALTLRGITHPLTVEAAAGLTDEGKAALQTTFTIDRTKWGILYGSGKFFQRLAGHLVNDELELQVRILTKEAVQD